MTIEQLSAVHWPHLPPLPAPGEPVLVRVPTTAPRATARHQLRTATRTLLAAWANLPASAITLQETPHGPVYPRPLHGHSADFSFSYTATAAWVALTLDRRIGLDALRPEPFAEMTSVARLYLGPAARAAIESSLNPAHTFAQHWTAHEARLKLSRRPLREHPSILTDDPTLREYALDETDTVVTLVVAHPPMP